jgi:hypothetical protein
MPLVPGTVAGQPRLLAQPLPRPVLAPRPKPGPGAGAATPPPVNPGGGGGKGPAPSGPPGSAAFGAASGAAGGFSSALWCDVLVVRLALGCRDLHPYRLRPTLAGPTGFAPLLQRPG